MENNHLCETRLNKNINLALLLYKNKFSRIICYLHK